MIRTYGKIPQSVGLALSGGCDSMAILDYLLLSRRQVVAIHFHHGDEYSSDCADLVTKYCKYRDVPLYISDPLCPNPGGMSNEMWWREGRYNYFSKVQSEINLPIITAHNLDDQVESWLMSTLRGVPRLIPSTRNNPNIIRPFLLTKKHELRDWCIRKAVPFLDDPENDNESHDRVIIRKNIMPQVLRVNPGIYTTVGKMVREEYERARGLESLRCLQDGAG